MKTTSIVGLMSRMSPYRPLTPFVAPHGELFAKLDATGAQTFAKPLGDGNNYDTIRVVVEPTSGDVIIGGSLLGTVNFGGGNRAAMGGEDLFVARYDAKGVYAWDKVFGDGGEQQIVGFALDKDGNVVLAGPFTGTLDFGGGKVLTASAGGSHDVFAARLGPSGATLSARSWGDAADQYAFGVCADKDGNLGATGIFSGTLDFGDGKPLTSTGGQPDGWVAKLAP